MRYRYCLQAAIVGILVNLILFAVKMIFGYMGGSQALVSDAFHSGGDCLVGVIVLSAIWISSRPADREHPYGHWKAESIAQGVVGLIIILIGANLIFQNTRMILEGDPVVPRYFTMLAAMFSLVLKEVTFRYTFHLGKKYSSPVVTASAYEHRSDALSSMAAFLGILAAYLGGLWGIAPLYYFDLLAGIMVSFLIIRMGYKVARESIFCLMDSMPSEGIQKEIKKEALSLKGVKEIHELRARYSGPCLHVDMVIGVDGSLNVEEGHYLAQKVEDRLKDKRGEIFSVWVHVHPCENDGSFDHV